MRLPLTSLILVCAILTGCNTFKVDPKRNSTDSLVIVPIRIEKGIVLGPRSYSIRFSDMDRKSLGWVVQAGSRAWISWRTDAPVFIDLVHSMPNEGYYGETMSQPVHIPLNFAPGQIAINDLTFVVTFNLSGGSGTSNWSLVPTTQEQRDLILSQLGKDAVNSSWFSD